MNFMRKSTEGWSIVNILLDFSGSIANYAQMSVQSIDQSMSSLLPKVLLVLFIVELINIVFKFIRMAEEEIPKIQAQESVTSTLVKGR